MYDVHIIIINAHMTYFTLIKCCARNVVAMPKPNMSKYDTYLVEIPLRFFNNMPSNVVLRSEYGGYRDLGDLLFN